jgi:predicted HicB family RNase H-like nuclease
MMQYKGYSGRVEFDDEADLFHGEVIGLRDVITFQGRSVDEVKAAFRDSVDDYLEFCARRGEEPEKPFTGKLMLRIPPDLHRKVYIAAKESGASLNSWIAQTLQQSTEDQP